MGNLSVIENVDGARPASPTITPARAALDQKPYDGNHERQQAKSALVDQPSRQQRRALERAAAKKNRR